MGVMPLSCALARKDKGQAAILGDSVWLQTICTAIFTAIHRLRAQPLAAAAPSPTP